MEDGGAISLRAIIVGALLGIVFAAAMSYVGAKTAFIDGANIPVSILSFGLLTVLIRARKPTVHDGNVVQTVASSATIMSITGGCMGPVAALTIAGSMPSMPLVVLWGIALGIVGSIIAAPLRTIFLEKSALPFPTGTATAEVLNALFSDAAKARRHLTVLAVAGIACFAFAIARSYLHWVPDTSYLPIAVAGVSASGLGLGISWSPLYVGLGFLSGARVAISLVVGGTIAWVVIAPVLVNSGIRDADFVSLLNWLFWPGTGLMIGGAVRGAWLALRAIRAAREGRGGLAMTRRNLVAAVIAGVAVVAFGALAFEVNPVFPLLGLVMSVAISVAAARAMGETDNTPAGPIGGVMQVVVGVIAPGGIHAPLSTGGVINGTLMHSAYMLQNWKTGSLTKTPPRTLFIAQIVGVVVGAVASAGAFLLIVHAYGLVTKEMPAPAALSWKMTADIAKVGISAMPAYAPLAAGIGFVLAIVLGAKSIARYVPSPVAMGMAFILPPNMTFVMAFGGLLHAVGTRVAKSRVEDIGLPVASGAIAGEAIAGIVAAVLIALGLEA